MTVLNSIEIPQNIEKALVKASKATGTDFDYLLQTAMRESSFNTDAKAQRSTATGLFQFIESTWLQTLKEEGGKLGLQKFASQISKNSFGNYVVSNPDTKARILDLRKDPEVSAMVAGAYAQRNEDYIETKIGRKPSTGEVYIAHFLGARDAAKLIQLSQMQPNAKADKYFSAAAAKNRNIFFDGSKAKTVGEVYNTLVQGYAGSSQDIAKNTNEGWNTVVNKTTGSVKPLNQKANFNSSDKGSEGAGSIGAWANILGNKDQESKPDAVRKAGKGHFSEIYSSD
ncbi:MAG: transglycosylase SLT domain-containing protein [Methyloligellaceae bacterium]